MKGDLLTHFIYRIFLVGCAALFSLTFISCASHPKYPSEWTALIPFEEYACPDISGTYDVRDEGTARRYVPADANRKTFSVHTTDDAMSHLYLYEVVPMKFFFTRGRITDATHVEIAQPDDNTLEINFLDDKGLIDKKIYSLQKKEYACSPKGIALHWGRGSVSFGVTQGIGGGYPYVTGGAVGGKYYLSKSLDGSLIVKEEGTAIMVFVVLPLWEKYSIWYRFKTYKE
jgi:hypothetical protein